MSSAVTDSTPAAPPPVAAPPMLRVHNLHRRFGPVHAVNGVSFEIPRGQVTGFIGQNGAGKTTTMRLIATLDEPDAGTIAIDGIDVLQAPGRVRPLVGWMPDHTGSYDLTTVLDYLDFFARAQGLRGAARRRRLQEVIEFTDLGALVARPMRALSKGEAQRLALARTLLHDPALLILDEPAAGLDPKARVEFRNLVRLLREQGKTLLISSHILSELGEMCDRLLFIHEGRIVHHGTAESLRRAHGSGDAAVARVRVKLTVAGAPAPLLEWLSVHPGWTLVASLPDGARADFAGTETAALAEELRRMILDGLPVAGFQVEERMLEDVFIDILKNVTAGPPPAPTTMPGSN